MAKNAPTPEELAQRQKANLPGVRMGKIRKHTFPTHQLSFGDFAEFNSIYRCRKGRQWWPIRALKGAALRVD